MVKKTRQRRAAGRKRIRWWTLKDKETIGEIPEKSSGKTVKHRRSKQQQRMRNNVNGGEKLLSKLRNVVRNYVEGQRERKQGWKAGGGMMRLRARLGRRKKD